LKSPVDVTGLFCLVWFSKLYRHVVPAKVGTQNRQRLTGNKLAASVEAIETLVDMGPGSRFAWPGRQ
jgi:hypothetical protein